MSIWDCEKPLDAMMLSHDHIAILAVKHEQQIKDIAAHLLELKRLVTPPMIMDDDDLNNVRYKANYRYETKWVGLTGAEVNHIFAENVGYPERMMKEVEAKLKEKNGG